MRATANLNAAGEPLRLGYLIDSLTTGGAERLVVSFGEEVVRRPNVDFTLFSLSDDQTPFRSELEAMGVEVVPLAGKSLVDPRRFFRLVGELRRRRIEYLHSHLTAATVLGAAATSLLRIPFSTTIHNVKSSVRRTGGARRRLYLNMLRQRGVHRIAVGQAVAEANLEDTGGLPMTVVPNAVPESAIWMGNDRAEARAELGVAEDEQLCLAVGLLIGQKGYPDLLTAFGKIAADHPRAKILIAGGVGWTELEAELLGRAAAMGLSDRFRLLGQRRDVPRLMAAADVFVSASHWEGAPVSLLEAMANRLPCVVTDVGDNRLTLQGTGCPTPPPEQPDAFAEALGQILSDGDLRSRCAEAVRQRVAEDYGVPQWVDRLLGIYADRMKRRDWHLKPSDLRAHAVA